MHSGYSIRRSNTTLTRQIHVPNHTHPQPQYLSSASPRRHISTHPHPHVSTYLRLLKLPRYLNLFFFFFNDPAPPEISPLSLHAAFPISCPSRRPYRAASHFGFRPKHCCVRSSIV